MKTDIGFQFSCLPQEVQDKIVATNDSPSMSWVDYEEWRLRFTDRIDYPYELSANMRLKLWDLDIQSPPTWLKTVGCEINSTEMCYGYLDNGRFRNGAAMAVVNTFVEEGRESGHKFLTTKIEITGQGPGVRLCKEAWQLYDLIRTRKLKKGHIVERWPVQVPEALVTIGAGPVVCDDESE